MGVTKIPEYRFRLEKTKEDILLWKYETFSKKWIVFQRLSGALVQDFESIKIKKIEK